MKKQILMLCALLSLSQCNSMYIQPAETSSLHSFANTYILVERPFFDNTTMFNWINAIDPIKKFVLDNNKNMFGMADKGLNEALNLFLQASTLFINTASEILRGQKILSLDQKRIFQNKINEVKNLDFLIYERIGKPYTTGSKKERVRVVLYDANSCLKDMTNRLEKLLQ